MHMMLVGVMTGRESGEGGVFLGFKHVVREESRRIAANMGRIGSE